MREEGTKTFIQQFIFTADEIKFYQMTSKNIFRKFIAHYQMKKLDAKLHKINDMIILKSILIEFIEVYNGSYDYYPIDGLYTTINPDNHVYTLKIDSYKEGYNNQVQIATINSQTNDSINITLKHRSSNIIKVIQCHDKLSVSGENKVFVDIVNSIVLECIKQYLKLYIYGNKKEIL